MDDGRAAGARSALPLQQQDYAGAMGEGAEGGAQRLLDALLRRSGLEHSDGRPLHRYQATEREVEALGNLLRANFRRHFPEGGKHIAGAFCLFIAHWFQRHGGTGHWSWDGPTDALGVTLDHAGRTRLTDAGLSYWQRPLRKREDGTRLFLASLIIEGGLPRAALTGTRWLGSYLGRVITDLERSLQAELEAASRHAHFQLHHIPETFQDEGLAELMAETALAVVDLRRKAFERPAGVDPVQWLNTVDADWRTNFPIQIEDDTIAQLIEGLVRNAIAPPPETQLVARVARIRDGRIEFGIEFAETASADSLLRQRWRDRLDGALRARLVPDGRFADALDSIPAILERLSGTDEAAWQLRCTLPQARRTVWGVDLATEARVSVTYESRVLGQGILPGGESADTDIAVFSFADDARDDEPGVLHLIGTGTTRTRARQVAVLVPASWRRSCEPPTSPDAPQSSTERLAVEDGRELLEVQGSVIFHAPDGAHYRVVTGAHGDRSARYFVGGIDSTRSKRRIRSSRVCPKSGKALIRRSSRGLLRAASAFAIPCATAPGWTSTQAASRPACSRPASRTATATHPSCASRACRLPLESSEVRVGTGGASLPLWASRGLHLM
jgi:hypothetical protein